MLVPRTRGASSSRPPHPAEQIRAPQTEIGTLRHAEGPHSCLRSSPVPAMASGPRTSRSVRRCSAVCAVATDCCYWFRTEWAGIRPQSGRFTLRILAERLGFEPRELVGLRFSSLRQGVRRGPAMTYSRGNRPIPRPRIRHCSALLLPAVATGRRPRIRDHGPAANPPTERPSPESVPHPSWSWWRCAGRRSWRSTRRSRRGRSQLADRSQARDEAARLAPR